MAIFKPFKALRPAPEYAELIAALPYDVMNSKEAAEAVKGNPLSFLHVDKAEIDLPPETDIYSEKVYLKARENLKALEKNHYCRQDTAPCFYIYRQIMNGRSQTGIVGCASIDDYIGGSIKRHEFTRADKEADRIRHVDYCDANTGPIFLTYRSNDELSNIISIWKQSRKPVYDFTTADGIRNTVWVIDDAEINGRIAAAFDATEALYIADGHHRCASAVKVGLKRREENPGYNGSEEFNFFLAVCFPSDELEIMDYNRVMKDLGGKSKEEFLLALGDSFTVEKVGAKAYRPEARHTFGMYLDKEWYKLTAKEGTYPENDPVASLDVSILQENCITPIFGITDPRTDKRIDFIGGIRGLGELEKRCGEDMAVAFSMFPTSLDELMAIADAGEVMPPKSTWFEPKLLSGLFIHKLK